jgi:hypothetical protein
MTLPASQLAARPILRRSEQWKRRDDLSRADPPQCRPGSNRVAGVSPGRAAPVRAHRPPATARRPCGEGFRPPFRRAFRSCRGRAYAPPTPASRFRASPDRPEPASAPRCWTRSLSVSRGWRRPCGRWIAIARSSCRHRRSCQRNAAEAAATTATTAVRPVKGVAPQDSWKRGITGARFRHSWGGPPHLELRPTSVRGGEPSSAEHGRIRRRPICEP